jgi:hypothetical protein
VNVTTNITKVVNEAPEEEENEDAKCAKDWAKISNMDEVTGRLYCVGC